jgi:hypothetical protein
MHRKKKEKKRTTVQTSGRNRYSFGVNEEKSQLAYKTLKNHIRKISKNNNRELLLVFLFPRTGFRFAGRNPFVRDTASKITR